MLVLLVLLIVLRELLQSLPYCWDLVAARSQLLTLQGSLLRHVVITVTTYNPLLPGTMINHHIVSVAPLRSYFTSAFAKPTTAKC
jgi:hypothetical protein